MSNDTYVTPKWITDVLGPFDYDPCAGADDPYRHARIVTTPDMGSGLESSWSGTVWLNPPYSKPYPWMKKLAQHGNGIALVNVCATTRWWNDWVWPYATAIRFLRRRIRFLERKEDGRWEPAVRPVKESVLIAYGLGCAARLLTADMYSTGAYVGLAGKTSILRTCDRTAPCEPSSTS